MKAFDYTRPTTVSAATTALTTPGRSAALISGGMDLLDLMKEELLTPSVVVSLADVPGLASVVKGADGSLTLGPKVTLAELASNTDVRTGWPALADAAAKAATPQIRNRATVGGNLLQRPRCWYFRKQELSCLKKGGSGCPAVAGENRYLAILGGGPCYSVHASSTACALVALGATLTVSGPSGTRALQASELFVAPSEDPTREHRLAAGEIVTAIRLPAPAAGAKNAYSKVRHKEAWDWAMAEVAVSLTVTSGKVSAARIVLGGVAPVPWRASSAEAVLVGKAPTAELCAQAGQAAVEAARPLSDNAYKVPAAAFVVEQALLAAAGLS